MGFLYGGGGGGERACVRVCVYVCASLCVRACVHECMYVFACVRACVCVCVGGGGVFYFLASSVTLSHETHCNSFISLVLDPTD